MESNQPITVVITKLGAYLEPRRLAHSRKVAECARALAAIHAPELVDQAELAGLVHDTAKLLTIIELLRYAEQFHVQFSPEEQRKPGLLHGKIGACLLPERFGITDPEVHAAVADHVMGRPGMGPLSKILYVADQIAADRSFPGIEDVRQIAMTDLDRAVWLVARTKLRYVIERGEVLGAETVALYNSMREDS